MENLYARNETWNFEIRDFNTFSWKSLWPTQFREIPRKSGRVGSYASQSSDRPNGRATLRQVHKGLGFWAETFSVQFSAAVRQKEGLSQSVAHHRPLCANWQQFCLLMWKTIWVQKVPYLGLIKLVGGQKEGIVMWNRSAYVWLLFVFMDLFVCVVFVFLVFFVTVMRWVYYDLHHTSVLWSRAGVTIASWGGRGMGKNMKGKLQNTAVFLIQMFENIWRVSFHFLSGVGECDFVCHSLSVRACHCRHVADRQGHCMN